MNKLAEFRRQLSTLTGDVDSEITRLYTNLDLTGHHQNACGDDIVIERLSVLMQQLKDAIHEIDNLGSTFSALKHALQDSRAKVRAWNTGIRTVIILDGKMKSFTGKTIVEAARKMHTEHLQSLNADFDVEGGDK